MERTTRQLSESEKECIKSLREHIKPEIKEAYIAFRNDQCETCGGQKSIFDMPKGMEFLQHHFHPCFCASKLIGMKQEKKSVEEKPKPKTVTIRNKSVPSLF